MYKLFLLLLLLLLLLLWGLMPPPPTPLPRPPPPGQRGTISNAHIDNCVAANALTTGATKWRQMSPILVSYGGWWTIYLAVDVYLRALSFWIYQRPLTRSTMRLLQRLQTSFGIDDSTHRWFQSYLSGRHQYVRRGSAPSTIVYLICGVPQGSVCDKVTVFMVLQRESDQARSRTIHNHDRSYV